MKLRDKKVIILGSFFLFVLSLLEKNDDKSLENNNLAIVSDVEPVKNNTGLSDVVGAQGVTDAPDSIVSSSGLEKAFVGVKFSDINISRDLYHADHYTITHGISAVDLARLNKEKHELELNEWGVRDQSEAVKQAKEKRFIFDDRLVSINGKNIDLDDKSKVTEWDMMPLIDNYGRVYNGENDVPYIPQFLIFGHVPLGWQLVYFIVEPEKSEEYRKAKEEEEKSWFERNWDKIFSVALNLIPVVGQVASALSFGASAIKDTFNKNELEHAMGELNSFLGRVNGLHGYFGLVPYEWDLPAFFRNELWYKENGRLMRNLYNGKVVVSMASAPDYVREFPWVYRFLGRAAILSGERVRPDLSHTGDYQPAYWEREGGTYPAGKFADYFNKGIIDSYNVIIFKYKDWKMTG